MIAILLFMLYMYIFFFLLSAKFIRITILYY